jgi:CBS domain-containing protein
MLCSVPSVSHSDLVTVAAKKMREYRVNSVVVMAGDMLQGILTYVLCEIVYILKKCISTIFMSQN